jgi:hypothetical protein
MMDQPLNGVATALLGQVDHQINERGGEVIVFEKGIRLAKAQVGGNQGGFALVARPVLPQPVPPSQMRFWCLGR